MKVNNNAAENQSRGIPAGTRKERLDERLAKI
jgi:hypothetical protein